MSTCSSTPTNFPPHLLQLVIGGTTLEEDNTMHAFVCSKCTSSSGSLIFTIMFQDNLLCPIVVIMLNLHSFCSPHSYHNHHYRLQEQWCQKIFVNVTVQVIDPAMSGVRRPAVHQLKALSEL